MNNRMTLGMLLDVGYMARMIIEVREIYTECQLWQGKNLELYEMPDALRQRTVSRWSVDYLPELQNNSLCIWVEKE